MMSDAELTYQFKLVGREFSAESTCPKPNLFCWECQSSDACLQLNETGRFRKNLLALMERFDTSQSIEQLISNYPELLI